MPADAWYFLHSLSGKRYKSRETKQEDQQKAKDHGGAS